MKDWENCIETKRSVDQIDYMCLKTPKRAVATSSLPKETTQKPDVAEKNVLCQLVLRITSENISVMYFITRNVNFLFCAK